MDANSASKIPDQHILNIEISQELKTYDNDKQYVIFILIYKQSNFIIYILIIDIVIVNYILYIIEL